MTTRLSILDSSGDLTLTWDHADDDARAKARAEVERLRSLGYSFFLADGTPADEIAAGGGTLIVRRLEPAEVIDPPADETARGEPEPAPEAADPPKRRRGRPPKADRQVVAVRPMRGG